MQNRVSKTRYPLAGISESLGLDCADGSTEAASIRKLRTDPLKRSVRPLVLSIVNKICQQETPETTRTIIKSLVWPFIARRSLRKEIFSDKEKIKFIDSMKITRDRVNKYTDNVNKEQAFVGYWLNVYMCQVFKDDQRPPREEWIKDNLFSGWCKRFISRSIAKVDTAFIYSLQKGSKRIWCQQSEEKRQLAYEKHKERLCTSRGECPADLQAIIRATSLEIFSSINRSTENTSFPTKCVPSVSACIQVLRENGGTRSMFDSFDPGTTQDSEEQVLGKLRSLHQKFSFWTNKIYLKAKERAFESHGKYKPFDVKGVGLFEPGKIRMITKGNGYLYTALQGLQGLLLDSWKSCRFSTMRDDDLTMRVRKLHKENDLEYFCSVDYEAATDLMKKDATLQCFRPLVNVPDYSLGLKALEENGTIYYPLNNPSPGVVVEGQLMGHPLSFPLLCTINLSVLRTACVRYLQDSGDSLTYELRKAEVKKILGNVLVNGDDMLFKCNKLFYDEYFKVAASDAGLKLSLGKNYLSKIGCMINSQVFQLKNGTMERIGYLNLKFLIPNDEQSKPTQLAKDLNKMMNLCPWTSCILPSVFLDRWFDHDVYEYHGSPLFPNWYLPVHLGGFGIDKKYSCPNNKITRQQRKLARVFIKDPNMQLFIHKNTDLDKISLKLSEYVGCLPEYKITDPYRPLNINETDEPHPWLGRLSLISDQLDMKRMRTYSVLGKTVNLNRIKPFSLDKIDRLWEVKLIANKGPELPTLTTLDYKRISFSKERWVNSPFFLLRKVLPLI